MEKHSKFSLCCLAMPQGPCPNTRGRGGVCVWRAGRRRCSCRASCRQRAGWTSRCGRVVERKRLANTWSLNDIPEGKIEMELQWLPVLEESS